jgi:hypothetical protein
VIYSILFFESIVYSTFVVIIFLYLGYLTIGISALSLAKEGETFLALFAKFFLKKRGGGTLQVQI